MPPELARFIRPGDGIVLGQACAEPQTLSAALVAQRAAFSGASVFLGVNYAGIVRPADTAMGVRSISRFPKMA